MGKRNAVTDEQLAEVWAHLQAGTPLLHETTRLGLKHNGILRARLRAMVGPEAYEQALHPAGGKGGSKRRAARSGDPTVPVGEGAPGA